MEIKRLPRCTAGGGSDSKFEKRFERTEPKGFLLTETKHSTVGHSTGNQELIKRKIHLQTPSRISFLNTANVWFF